jgi:hypothetical protein
VEQLKLRINFLDNELKILKSDSDQRTIKSQRKRKIGDAESSEKASENSSKLNKQEDKVVNLADLPFDCLSAIFDVVPDKKSISLTCKNLYKAVCEYQAPHFFLPIYEEDLVRN